MDKYLPYIVTIASAIISGVASYFAARRQTKADLQKLETQHKLDIEKEREMFAMEKEKIELEHRHQLELKEKELENQLGTDLISVLTKEYIRTPEGQAQIKNVNKKKHK